VNTQQVISEWWNHEISKGYQAGRKAAFAGDKRPDVCPHVELAGGNPIQCGCPDETDSEPYHEGYFMGWDLAQIDL
jgi:hypothetical protein